jgi:cyclophilin family peptidyl-prolyl cis-trans isomerase
MIMKMNMFGVLAAALLICGCVKKTPQNPAGQQNVQQNNNTQTERENVSTENKKVKLQTTMGDIVIEMESQAAPNTVKNFIQYVESGFYNGIIFHRVIPGFMIQGGGFTVNMEQKKANAPVKNEFKISNTRGTVAMAKLGGNPDSATCQFFISVADNSSNLDHQNGGFTVFGKVVEGMDVVDKIVNVKTTVRSGMPDVPVEPVVINSAIVISQ